MAVAEIIRKASTADKIKTEIVSVTPKMAEEWLGRHPHNRSLAKTAVNAMAADMAAGDWQLSGEAIKFDDKGNLLDGQHRLQACIKAGVPFQTVVIRGLDTEAQNVMDTGRPRTFSDVLSIHGHANAVKTASAARNLHYIKKGQSTDKVSVATALRIFEKHPMLVESVFKVKGAYGIAPSLLATIHYIGARILDKESIADDFVRVFITGNSYDDCAAHVWRERLMRMKASHTVVTRAAMFYGSIHVWNNFARGNALKLIRIPDTAKIEGLDVSKI